MRYKCNDVLMSFCLERKKGQPRKRAQARGRLSIIQSPRARPVPDPPNAHRNPPLHSRYAQPTHFSTYTVDPSKAYTTTRPNTPQQIGTTNHDRNRRPTTTHDDQQKPTTKEAQRRGVRGSTIYDDSPPRASTRHFCWRTRRSPPHIRLGGFPGR